MFKLLEKQIFFRIIPVLLLAIWFLVLSVTSFSDANAIQMEITPTSITLYWTAPGDDNNIGVASQYDIRYSTSPITEQNWDEATQATGEPIPSPSGSDELFDVTDLASSTTYYFAIKSVDESGNWSGLSNIESATTLPLGTGVDVPDNFELSQNYPNPFNAATRIDYYISAPGHVTLSVYDLLGRTISTIVDEQKTVGEYDAFWSGLDADGAPVASGLYFYRLHAGDQNYTRKMLLLK